MMTNEEAIETLDFRISRAEYFGRSYADNIDLDTLRLAKDALEKQMPKKPMTQINDNERWVCPNCKTMIWMMFRFKYCPYCGQAIDWSEEKANYEKRRNKK